MNNTANNTLQYRVNQNTEYLKINDWRMDFLCDYIETNHHSYIRKMMPKILSVCKNLYRENETELNLMKELNRLSVELDTHMHKEEKLLFKYIKKLNAISAEKSEYEIPPFGSISNLIKVMGKEHINATAILENIKAVCSGFKIKQGDSEVKIKLYEYLTEFYTDFQFHVYIENQILYPKSISLEKKLKKYFLKK